MIEKNSDINKQIFDFIKYSIIDNVPIYNSRYILSGKQNDRIEFHVGSFVSTGRIYSIEEETSTELIYGSSSDYRCQLVIRVLGSPEFTAKYAGMITGAIQAFGILETIIKDIEIQNETMRVRDIPYTGNGVISSIPEISVNCVVCLSYKRDIDYFDKIRNVEVKFK